jgi:autotransporter-associated beta strand protein
MGQGQSLVQKVAICSLAGLVTCSVGAADYTWLASPATGSWNLTDENWSGAGSIWVSGSANSAFFGSSGTTAVTADAVTLQHLTFNADGYAIGGGPLLMYGSPTVGAGLTATLGATVTNVGVWGKSGAGTLVLSPGALTNTLYSMKVATGTLHVVSGTTLVTMPNSDPENGPAFWVEGGTLVVGGGLMRTTTNKYARVSGGGSLIVTNGLVDLTQNDELLNAHNTAGTTTVSGTGVLDVKALRISQQFGPASAAVVNVNTGGTIRMWNFNLDASSKRNGTVNLNGGTLVAKAEGAEFFNTGHTNWSGIVAYVREGGAIIDNSGKNITVRQALLSGVANDGGLTKKGAGILNLRGDSTYRGGTFLWAGSLNITSDTCVGAAPASPATNFTFVGSSTLMSSANHALAANRTIRIPTNVTATFDTQSYTQTISGVIYGENRVNSLIKVGAGMLILDPGATSGFTVATLKPQAGTIYVKSGSNLVNIASGGVQSSGLYLNNSTVVVGGGSLRTTGVGYVTSTGGSLIITNGVVNFNNNSELLNAYAGPGNVTVSGNGTLELKTLRISQAGAPASANVVNVNTGGVIRLENFFIDVTANMPKGTVNFNGGSVVAKIANDNLLGTGHTNWLSGIFVNVLAGGAVIDSDVYAISIKQPLYSGAAVDGGLTKIGLGALTLATTNTYNGLTSVRQGTLKLSVTNTLLTSGSVYVASNAVLDVAGKVQTLLGIGGSGTVSNNALLTVTGAVVPGVTNGIGTLTLAATPAALGGLFVVDAALDGTCDRLHVRGDLNLSALSLSVASAAAQMDKFKIYTIATCTGALSGSFLTTSLPDGWLVRYDTANRRAYLVHPRGTVIMVL